jgi:hypothetical protein
MRSETVECKADGAEQRKGKGSRARQRLVQTSNSNRSPRAGVLYEMLLITRYQSTQIRLRCQRLG